MQFTYEIKARREDLGGGWILRLLQDGEEVGGGVFPPVRGIDDPEIALLEAYTDAEDTAQEWLNSRL